MDLPHAHIILPTNATSAANPLAATTPTAIARDTVIQTNFEGEPLEYREIKTTTENTTKPMTTKTTTTTVEDTPASTAPVTTENTTKKTTTTVEEVPSANEYVLKEADVLKPRAVISDTTPVTSGNNQIVGKTASGSLTTPGKIVGDLEPVLSEHQRTTIAEPVTKKVVTTETKETKK